MLPAAVTAEQRSQVLRDSSARAVLGVANRMVSARENALTEAPGQEAAAPQTDEGAAEVQDNGTNPASMRFSFTPYTRYTELENGVTSSDVLTLFASIPIPLTPATLITVEWPVQSHLRQRVAKRLVSLPHARGGEVLQSGFHGHHCLHQTWLGSCIARRSRKALQSRDGHSADPFRIGLEQRRHG